MKFGEITFEKPDIKAYEIEFNKLINKFDDANSFDQQNEVLKEIYVKRDDFDTMSQLAFFQYTGNTQDKKLKDQSDFMDSILPVNQNLTSKYYKSLVNSKFKGQLTNKWGRRIFDLANYKLKGFDPSIMKSLAEENSLSSEFIRIKGSASIDFEGKMENLAGIMKYLSSKDRTIREKAFKARWDFFQENQEELDDIFDRLVKLRHGMSTKLGFENFVKLGYIRMDRVDFDEHMVSDFRDSIRKYISPIAKQIRSKQQKRLGLDQLERYDLGYFFKTGNPTPKGSPQEILDYAGIMYEELSNETDEFFKYLVKYDLIDVINRPGKAIMGYCWFLSNYQHPYIFANFNGTKHDVDVLTHEAGHAFQYFCCRENEIIEYRSPGSETAEIHSMAMEFLTYPWMDGFFKEDTQKYFYNHMSSAVSFLPGGCKGDHFQQIIYENPGFTPDERGDVWNEMCKLYEPDINRTRHPVLDKGRDWHRVGHFFESPFYFVDYVMAQICALQFLEKSKHDRKSAWNDYVKLCKLGGSIGYLDLLKASNLKSPFEESTVASVSATIKERLDNFDDSGF